MYPVERIRSSFISGSLSRRERRMAPMRKFVGRGGDCSARERHFRR